MLPLALRSPLFLPASLFENHLTLWLALIAIAVALIFAARSRANRRLMLAGTLFLALTLLSIATALLFDTPAERLHTAHLSLAQAAKTQDINKLLSFLAPSFTASNLGITLDSSLTSAKEELSARLKQYNIKDSSFTAYTSNLGPDHTAFTQITLLTQSDLGPLLTSWQLSWIDAPASNWQIQNAQLTKLGNTPVPSTEILR